MSIDPVHLQMAYDVTFASRETTDRLLNHEPTRTPEWMETLISGRSEGRHVANLRQAADVLEGDMHLVDEDVRRGLKEANDYLRGAAWHAEQGTNTLKSSISQALAGNDELLAQIGRVFEAPLISNPQDFELIADIARRSGKTSILGKIAEAVGPARGSFEQSLSDIEIARNLLRNIARVTPH